MRVRQRLTALTALTALASGAGWLLFQDAQTSGSSYARTSGAAAAVLPVPVLPQPTRPTAVPSAVPTSRLSTAAATRAANPSSPPSSVATTARAAAGRGLADAIIALDPGHNRDNAAHAETRRLVDAGGFTKECNTTGTSTDDGYAESRFTMEIADKIRARLEAAGATVRLTRSRDGGWGPCVDARGRFGGEVGADLLLSLHADGSTTPGDAGFHVIRPGALPGWTDDVESGSAVLAVAVRDALVAAGLTPSNYRGRDGIDVRTDLGTLNWASVPTVIVETHNMRDAREARVFRSEAGQDRLAEALVRAVAVHLGRSPSPPR